MERVECEMKENFRLFILFALFLITPVFFKANAQNPEWMNLSNGQSLLSLADEGDVIWIETTSCGFSIFRDSGIGRKVNILLTVKK